MKKLFVLFVTVIVCVFPIVGCSGSTNFVNQSTSTINSSGSVSVVWSLMTSNTSNNLLVFGAVPRPMSLLWATTALSYTMMVTAGVSCLVVQPMI